MTELAKKIVNLTQHKATPAQVAVGVFDIEDEDEIALLRRLLTFHDVETEGQIEERAVGLVGIAKRSGAGSAMVGGAPYLMPPLNRRLAFERITPLFAFSKRESTETVDADGNTEKTVIFKHLGFVKCRV